MTVMVTVNLTSVAPSIAEHVTVGSTGWVSAIEPQPVVPCVSGGRSHAAPLHCISGPSHRSHMRQAIGFCDSIELALKSGDSALLFSVLTEVRVVSVGNGMPRISTLDQHSRVSISCSRRALKAVL